MHASTYVGLSVFKVLFSSYRNGFFKNCRLGLTCDAIVMLLMHETGQNTDGMFERHANME